MPPDYSNADDRKVGIAQGYLPFMLHCGNMQRDMKLRFSCKLCNFVADPMYTPIDRGPT